MSIKHPKRIWLQGYCHEECDVSDTTWCQDKIEDDDVEYIRMDLHKAALARAKVPAAPPCDHKSIETSNHHETIA